jgi:hypothetical protein
LERLYGLRRTITTQLQSLPERENLKIILDHLVSEMQSDKNSEGKIGGLIETCRIVVNYIKL